MIFARFNPKFPMISLWIFLIHVFQFFTNLHIMTNTLTMSTKIRQSSIFNINKKMHNISFQPKPYLSNFHSSLTPPYNTNIVAEVSISSSFDSNKINANESSNTTRNSKKDFFSSNILERDKKYGSKPE